MLLYENYNRKCKRGVALRYGWKCKKRKKCANRWFSGPQLQPLIGCRKHCQALQSSKTTITDECPVTTLLTKRDLPLIHFARLFTHRNFVIFVWNRFFLSAVLKNCCPVNYFPKIGFKMMLWAMLYFCCEAWNGLPAVNREPFLSDCSQSKRLYVISFLISKCRHIVYNLSLCVFGVLFYQLFRKRKKLSSFYRECALLLTKNTDLYNIFFKPSA